MKLELDYREHHSFNESYHWILEKSGLFTIEKKETDEYNELSRVGPEIFNKHKFGGVSFVRIDGKLIVIDTTFEVKKTKQLIDTGIFNKIKPDLCIKYEPNDEISNLVGCKVNNWVMFPAGSGLVSSFQWNGVCNRVGTLASGKSSLKILGRAPWFDKARQHSELFNVYVACKQRTYCNSLRSSKFGVILSIRRDKNTREYEFISNFIPMALNYKPVYPFAFEPGEHYYYMETPDDLLKLSGVNAIPFHTRSVQLWENYFRPDKAVELLLSNFRQN